MLDLNDAAEQGRRPSETRPERYVRWRDIKDAVKGRETDVLDKLGIDWRPPRNAMHVHCPFHGHDDKNPSWRWDEGKARAHCSCTPSMSIFDVLKKVEGLGDDDDAFETAKLRVTEMIGREDLIVDPVAQSAQLGCTLRDYAETKRLPIDFLRRIGVGQCSYGKIPAVVRIPYYNEHGKLQTTQFRLALHGKDNQRFKKGTTVCLYGAQDAVNLRNTDFVVLCEGASDIHTLWLHGIPSLGIPGAGAWSEERDAHLLTEIPTIFVIIEPDQAGEGLRKKLSASVIAPKVRLIRLPKETKDPSALYLANPESFKTAFQAAMDAAVPFAPDEIRSTSDHNKATTKPAISVLSGALHIAADEGLTALHAGGVEFYQRHLSLVRVARIKAKASDGTAVTTPGIIPVTLPLLRRTLAQSARWVKLNAKGEAFPIDPPKDVTEQIAAMVGEWPFGVLAGVIGTPTLRPDGSLLFKEGYDEATGLALLALPKMPAIPDEPTKADAEIALALLKGLLREFPFVNGKGKSVALSMLMTPVLRGGLPPAVPMHLVSKPAAGTGGSYLADIASTIATGERCAVMSVSPKPDETEKRLIGAAISGFPIIALDNCNAIPLSGDFLCQVTERPLLQLRPLGKSPEIRVANTFTTFANGNQASVTDDVVRRTISCMLDANMENPEDREFKHNPLAMIMADRGRYIAACLTIARAYIVAGRPGKLRPLLSFERWSDTVRSSLVWLGRPDPVATMATARAEDPRRAELAAVMHQWAAVIGNNRVSVSEVIDIATHREKGSGTDFNHITFPFTHPALREALLVVARDNGGYINSWRLGKWLSSVKGRILNKKKLELDGMKDGNRLWKLSDASQSVA